MLSSVYCLQRDRVNSTEVVKLAKGRKTKRTALKRFWKTGSGRIMRQKIGGSHYMLKKSKRRQRDLKKVVEAPRTYRKALKGLLD